MPLISPLPISSSATETFLQEVPSSLPRVYLPDQQLIDKLYGVYRTLLAYNLVCEPHNSLDGVPTNVSKPLHVIKSCSHLETSYSPAYLPIEEKVQKLPVPSPATSTNVAASF